jgi:hypothetical protein
MCTPTGRGTDDQKTLMGKNPTAGGSEVEEITQTAQPI